MIRPDLFRVAVDALRLLRIIHEVEFQFIRFPSATIEVEDRRVIGGVCAERDRE